MASVPAKDLAKGSQLASMLTAFCRSALVTGAYFEGSVSVHNPIMAQLENFRLEVFRAATEHLNFTRLPAVPSAPSHDFAD